MTRPGDSTEVAPRSTGDAASLTARAYARWCHFWFEPEETSTLAIIRILFGIVVLAWTLTFLPDLRAFFHLKVYFRASRLSV